MSQQKRNSRKFILLNQCISTLTLRSLKKLLYPSLSGKKNVDDSLVKHGAQWVTPRYIKKPVERIDEESSSGPNKPRKRTVPYVWYTEFKCHRFGTCCDKVAEGVRVKGGSSDKPRELQKASKKTDCKAKLKATCLKNDPNSVETVHIGVHNHEVREAEDLKYLSLSKRKRKS